MNEQAKDESKFGMSMTRNSVDSNMFDYEVYRENAQWWEVDKLTFFA